jgi:hypothetical protein
MRSEHSRRAVGADARAGRSAFVSGNENNKGWNLNDNGNHSEYSAIKPTTTDAITAARDVKAQAGARGPTWGLDEDDRLSINSITIP